LHELRRWRNKTLRNKAQRYLFVLTGVLLTLEGVYFFWFSYAIAHLFRSAPNIRSSDALPGAVWSNAFWGTVLLMLAVVYFVDPWRLSRRLAPLGLAALAYGIWSVSSAYPLMMSLSGAFRGDAVALIVLSGFGFIAMGVSGILVRLLGP
jgi:hypothetical protein